DSFRLADMGTSPFTVVKSITTVMTIYTVYTNLSIPNIRHILALYMPAKGKTSLSLNIDPDLLARIDKYRHRRMLVTRTEAREFLLDAGLKANPEKPTPKKEE